MPIIETLEKCGLMLIVAIKLHTYIIVTALL